MAVLLKTLANGYFDCIFCRMSKLYNYNNETITGKKALITGASSGIGRAAALALAEAGAELFIVARRAEKLTELKNIINSARPELKITTIIADVTSEAGIKAIKDADGFEVDILINNAGGALGKDNVESASQADWDGMIASNLTAATRVVRETMPHMLKSGGDIITIASIAGHQPYEGGSIYCAVKSGIRAFCQALRQESCGKNIRVMTISPGLVETEFSLVRFHGDENKAASVYAGMQPLTANDIAAQIMFALTLPRHVCLDEIVTMPTAQGSATKVVRKL